MRRHARPERPLSSASMAITTPGGGSRAALPTGADRRGGGEAIAVAVPVFQGQAVIAAGAVGYNDEARTGA